MKEKLFTKKMFRCTALLCGICILVSRVTVYASSTQQLEEKTSALQGQLADMNQELSSLSGQLDETTKAVEAKAGEVDQAHKDLALAVQDEAAQYDSMKERIKFMYEGGNVSLLQILLSSEDMGDFLNKAEYVSNISDYDREMLDAFQAARTEVENRQASLEAQQEELSALKDDLSSQADTLEERISSSSSALDKYSAQLQKAKEAQALAAQKALAEEQAKQEQEAAAKKATEAAKKQTQTSAAKDKQSQKSSAEETEEEAQDPESASSDGLTNLGSFRITHYCNCSVCCGKWSGGNTASGTTPTAGRTIAVDPSVIPMGSQVVINGHTYIAEDTGTAIKGKRIDIYVNDHSTALSCGTYYADVYVK